MIIKMVTFEVQPEGKERFQQKMTSNVASLNENAACLGCEAWYSETKHSLEFTLVSRWHDKKDFQNWLKRPEHLQAHRDAHKNKQQPSLVIKKTVKEFVVIE